MQIKNKIKNKKTSISWSPDKILYLACENKTKCNRVVIEKKRKKKIVCVCIWVNLTKFVQLSVRIINLI